MTSRHARQSGQAMVEYTVVIAFGLLVLTTGNPSPIQQVITAIQGNYRGYSYAVSLSTMPDQVTVADAVAACTSAGIDPDKCQAAGDAWEYLDSIDENFTSFPSFEVSFDDINWRDFI